ncbi:diaminopimelate epimerase [Tistrella mobilis]|uniref:diaminopimelate epimerase n=1 Tax=Tistrella mobilis TaxID=171437 RepID=UPI0035573E5D
MIRIPFLKMHGLGNDFVVIDRRSGPARGLVLDDATIRRISDRRHGVGCDQFILIDPTDDDPIAAGGADAVMRIHNADGGEVGACGNATRCVGALLMDESGLGRATIATISGLLRASRDAEQQEAGTVTVDMGPARLDWRQIPLAAPADTLAVEAVEVGPLKLPVAVNVGNPHAVFFVDNAEAIDLTRWGPMIERHPAFPERTNVEVAHLLGPDRLRMRVWERGAGITAACGTGACATAVAAIRRGLTGRTVEIVLDGGPLVITWTEDDRVLMSGPVATSFEGTLHPSLLA